MLHLTSMKEGEDLLDIDFEAMDAVQEPPSVQGQSAGTPVPGMAYNPYMGMPFLFPGMPMPFGNPFLPMMTNGKGVKGGAQNMGTFGGFNMGMGMMQPSGVVPTMDELEDHTHDLTASGSSNAESNAGGGRLKRRFHSCPDLPQMQQQGGTLPKTLRQGPLLPLPPSKAGGGRGTYKATPATLSRGVGMSSLDGTRGKDANRMRSITSCPDMSMLLYGAMSGLGVGAGGMGVGLSGDEERRQKRLARNRASARVRRMRKKTLVDAYELDVQRLEKSVQQLKAHRWGEGREATLREALGMDTASRPLAERAHSAAQVRELRKSLAKQMSSHVEGMEESLLEAFVLPLVAGARSNLDPQGGSDSEIGQIEKGLADALGMDPRSLPQECNPGLYEQHLGQQNIGATELLELRVLSKIYRCTLNKLPDLLNLPTVDNSLSAFVDAATQPQMAKLVSWAETNRESVGQLPVCETERNELGAFAARKYSTSMDCLGNRAKSDLLLFAFGGSVEQDDNEEGMQVEE